MSQIKSKIKKSKNTECVAKIKLFHLYQLPLKINTLIICNYGKAVKILLRTSTRCGSISSVLLFLIKYQTFQFTHYNSTKNPKTLAYQSKYLQSQELKHTENHFSMNDRQCLLFSNFLIRKINCSPQLIRCERSTTVLGFILCGKRPFMTSCPQWFLRYIRPVTRSIVVEVALKSFILRAAGKQGCGARYKPCDKLATVSRTNAATRGHWNRKFAILYLVNKAKGHPVLLLLSRHPPLGSASLKAEFTARLRRIFSVEFDDLLPIRNGRKPRRERSPVESVALTRFFNPFYGRPWLRLVHHCLFRKMSVYGDRSILGSTRDRSC